MTGWKCPGCGACYSPLVEACMRCGPTHRKATSTPVGPIAPRPPGPLASDTLERHLHEKLLRDA